MRDPTQPDVRLLIERLGVPRPGALFTHQQIEDALGVKRPAARYWSVIGAWKGWVLRNLHLVLEAQPGVGYEALNPSRHVWHCSRHHKLGLRRVVRNAQTAAIVKPGQVSIEEARIRDHIMMTTAAMIKINNEIGQEVLRPEPIQRISFKA